MYLFSLLIGKHKSIESLVKGDRASLDKAVKRLHEFHVVHNDLKSDNVLFCDDGKVFIIDYGFSELKPIDYKASDADEENYMI
jgi:serine/threonine protein kinase